MSALPLSSQTPECTSPKVQVYTQVIKRCAKSSPHRAKKRARGPLLESPAENDSNFTPLYVNEDVNDRSCDQIASTEDEVFTRSVEVRYCFCLGILILAIKLYI